MTESKFYLYNPDGTIDREMLDLAARHYHQLSNQAEMQKALELSRAGWVAQLGPAHSPHPFTGAVDVMSWYWRRPSRSKGRNGRLFLSTGQAYNALARDSITPNVSQSAISGPAETVLA